jgi:transposase
MKHIGLDLGRATTDAVVLNGRGQECLHRRVETRAEALVELMKSIPGEKRVVLEESQMADWVTRVLQPHVSEVIRSQPQHNRLISRAENQDDYLDALHLAQLLFMNQLKAVHHPDPLYLELREAVRAYWRSSGEVTRSKNHVKVFLLFHGIPYQKDAPYSGRHREKFREAIGQKHANLKLAECLWLKLDQARAMKARFLKLLRQVSKPVRSSVRRLMTIPGIGFISACTLLAYLEQGGRFSNKRQAWQYAGLGVSRHTSAGQGTENASRSGNRYLKNVLLTAAITVSLQPQHSALGRLWQRGIQHSMDPRRVRRTVGRKILVVAQHLLGSQKEYQDELMTIAS